MYFYYNSTIYVTKSLSMAHSKVHFLTSLLSIRCSICDACLECQTQSKRRTDGQTPGIEFGAF